MAILMKEKEGDRYNGYVNVFMTADREVYVGHTIYHSEKDALVNAHEDRVYDDDILLDTTDIHWYTDK